MKSVTIFIILSVSNILASQTLLTQHIMTVYMPEMLCWRGQITPSNVSSGRQKEVQLTFIYILKKKKESTHPGQDTFWEYLL